MDKRDFKDWQERCGFNDQETASVFGIQPSKVKRMLAGKEKIPQVYELACLAIDMKQRYSELNSAQNKLKKTTVKAFEGVEEILHVSLYK